MAMAVANQEQAEEACRRAEEFFLAGNIASAHRLARRAQKLCPSLPAVANALAAYDVHAAATANSGCPDWYAVLGIDQSNSAAVTSDAIKRQFRRRSLLVHPDKNRFAAADGAFKLLRQARDALSDGAPHHHPNAGAASASATATAANKAADTAAQTWWSHPNAGAASAAATTANKAADTAAQTWWSHPNAGAASETWWSHPNVGAASETWWSHPNAGAATATAANKADDTAAQTWWSEYLKRHPEMAAAASRRRGAAADEEEPSRPQRESPTVIYCKRYCKRCDREFVREPDGFVVTCRWCHRPVRPPWKRSKPSSPLKAPPPPPRRPKPELFPCPGQCPRCGAQFASMVCAGKWHLRCKACSKYTMVDVQGPDMATCSR